MKSSLESSLLCWRGFYIGFPKIGSTILGWPRNKSSSILGSLLGYPYIGKLSNIQEKVGKGLVLTSTGILRRRSLFRPRPNDLHPACDAADGAIPSVKFQVFKEFRTPQPQPLIPKG